MSRIVKMEVYPVAGKDCMELNLSGAHAPYFTRNIVVLYDENGETGVGEVPGGEKITKALEECIPLVEGTRVAEYKSTLLKVKAHLEDGQLAKTFVTEDEDEQALLNECNLLTAKPVIFAANVSEDDLADDGAENDYVQKVREYAKSCEAEVFVVCAQIEQEIAELDDDEKAMFLEDLGLKESGLEKLIKASYSLLGLISYLTAGPIESKAWTITRGTKAPQAAGKIHSDFERGFIKADVISYEDLIANGSMTAARDKGLVRSEGKEYVMQDGDVVLFKFNV
jgi:GTP-binding protein YchF